jgi:serine/threonine protein kinase
MGQVYLAQDLRLNRPVAVKLLSGYGVAEEERMGLLPIVGVSHNAEMT